MAHTKKPPLAVAEFLDNLVCAGCPSLFKIAMTANGPFHKRIQFPLPALIHGLGRPNLLMLAIPISLAFELHGGFVPLMLPFFRNPEEDGKTGRTLAKFKVERDLFPASGKQSRKK